MKESDSFSGLFFKKLDLHIHTPASRCFKGKCQPEDIVQYALKQNLDGIAITDHNSAYWIDKVNEAAKGSKLAVFPGVEISCTGGETGIHIIGLFEINSNSNHIEATLNLLGISPDQYGIEETITNKSPIETIKIIYENGGIPVLAHSNSSHGVLGDMKGQQKIRTIQSKYLLAAECTDYLNEEKKNKSL